MPKFIVTKSVDAFANYVAIVEAKNAAEARELAEDVDDWKEDGVTEHGDTDYDNVAPERVADDFTFGPSDADVMGRMLGMLHIFRSTIEFYRAIDDRAGDGEGSKLKTVALAALNDVIADAGGRIAERHAGDPLAPWAEIATAEGWGTFQCSDGWEIQRDDEAEIFLGDDDAIAYVTRRAAAGSLPHILALDFVKRNARPSTAG